MINRLVRITSVIIFIAFTANANADKPKTNLTILGIEYPPYISATAVGNGPGYAFIRQLLAPFDLEVNAEFLPLPRVQLVLNEGLWCASFIEPLQHMDQIEKLIFPARDLQHRLYRLKQKSDFSFGTFSELKGKKIAMLRTRDEHPVKVKLEQAGLISVPINTPMQGVKLLLHQRVDLIFSDPLAITYLTQKLSVDHTLLQASDKILFTSHSQLWLNLKCVSAKRAFQALKPFTNN